MSCLAIDIGNTSTAIGIVSDGQVHGVCHLQGGLRDRRAIEHVVRGLIGREEVDGSALSSVVPSANSVWLSQLRRLLGAAPLVVSHRLRLGVGVDYPRPGTIGADRLANASGAVGRYGAPAIVADFGTAVTFDVISSGGAYIGGVIAPGLPLMTAYLAEKTALLPLIRLTGRCGRIGRGTAGAMLIGAKIGYRGMVREIVRHLREGVGLRKARLLATGGYARWALHGLNLPCTIDPDLTLYGIGRIYELNTRG